MPTPVPIPILGGVNLSADARAVRDDQCLETRNVIPSKEGRPQKRLGCGRFAREVDFGAANNWTPLQFFQPDFDTSTDLIMLAVVSGTFYLKGLDIDSVTQSYDTGIASDSLFHRWQQFECGGNTYILPGYPFSKGGMIKCSNATTMLETYSFGTGANLPAPAVGCMYRQRPVYADFGPGHRGKVVFADKYAPATVGTDVLAANGRWISVGNELDPVVAMCEVTQQGAVSTASLLILTRRRAFLLTGEPSESTTVTDDFIQDCSLSVLNADAGCCSAQTLCRTPAGIIWASDDDVWCFEAGQAPRRIGSNISAALKYTGFDWRWTYTAVFFNGFYRLSLWPVGTSPLTSGVGQEQWWLDLRRGAPQGADDARWYGPQVYAGQAAPMIDYKQPGGEHVLLLPATDSGTVSAATHYALLFGQADMSPGWDEYGLPSPVNFSVAPTWYTGRIISKEYTGDDRLDKIHCGLEAGVLSADLQRWKLETLIDGGRILETAYASTDQAGVLLDVDDEDAGNTLERTFQTLPFYADELYRRIGKSIQYRLSDMLGFVVDDSNDTFLFKVNGTLYTAAVTQSFYTSASDLAVAVAAAMTTAWGGGTVTGSASNYSTCTFSFSGGISSCAVVGVVQTGATQAQINECRKLLGWLGFPTDVNTTGTTSVTGDTNVSTYPASSFELAGVVGWQETIPRWSF